MGGDDKTRIQLLKKTAKRLKERKMHPFEPYDSIINRLLDEDSEF